jgi:hypothetical protein
VPALSTPRCSEIPGACVPAVGPTLIMAAASQPMEAGDAEDAIPLTQPMFDGDATDDDPPAPRLVVTDDAETGATVPSHELPVPEVGDAIVVLGRATLAQALATQDQHVPDFLQQLSDNVKGLVELVDTREDFKNIVGRLHAALRITRLPGHQLRLSIRDCTRRNAQGATHSLLKAYRTRIFRGTRELIVTDDSWTEIQDGDVMHVCPTRAVPHDGKLIYKDYKTFKFHVTVPRPHMASDEGNEAQQAQPHMIKLVLPNRCIGHVMGKQGRIKQGLETAHNCSIELASRRNIHPGLELMAGRALGLTSPSAEGLQQALRGILELTGSPPEGFHLLVPVQTVAGLQGHDGHGLHRLADRLQGHQARLQLLPLAHVSPSLKEQVLVCHGSIDAFLCVVAHVVTFLGPKTSCLYAPVEPIHFKAPGPGDGDDDGSGRQHFRGGGLYSKAQRDRAAQRGHNAARNHVLRVAHRNMRQSRNQCRGISKTKRR